MSGRSLHGCLVAVVVLAVTLLAAMLLGRAWSACDAGVNSSANGGFLILIFVPVLWSVLMLIWLGVGAFLGDRPLIRAFALMVLLLTVFWCSISLFWGGDTYRCPSGVPPWWPHFIPAPGF
ncbi:dolichyl-diphosphooligosaccharide--protein glycosyltransferase subunit 2 [Streptomyces sp. TRM72054]|nr:dolichyl-diphosphooligosaccharide--protein glycosyltransferase subunit 2 [Streptomyces sp. TRM72054]